MADSDDETKEPTDDSAAESEAGAPQSKGRRRSFRQVRRELNEDELGSSGVQKMLLDELERMDGAENELKSVKMKYFEAEKSLAVTSEKLKTHHAFDLLSTGTVAIGSLVFGGALSLENTDRLFWILVVVSLILVAIGIIAKVVRA